VRDLSTPHTTVSPARKLRQPHDPMSAHLPAWAATTQFKLASAPRSVVPQQRNSRSTSRVLTAGFGATLPRPQHVRDHPLGPPSLSFVSQPREPWSSTKHSLSMGPPSRISQLCASRSPYETPASPGRDCACSGIGRHHVRSASATPDSPLRPDGASSGHREVPTAQASAYQRASRSSTGTGHRRVRGAARQKAVP
jgi:hypothetical protein